MERPLLYPMDEAGLRARPAPVACAASDTPPRWRAPAQADEGLRAAGEGLRASGEGLRPAGEGLRPAEPCPDDTDAPEEEGPDAMPTGQMPLPVCVPLDENPFAPRRRVWPWALGAVVICALLALGFWIFPVIG